MRPVRRHAHLTGLSGWDPYDTVFKVTTKGRTGIIAPSTYTMSASASASGHGAQAAADSDCLTYWDSGKTLPVRLDSSHLPSSPSRRESPCSLPYPRAVSSRPSPVSAVCCCP
ncbi:hypothetical protein [Streptomyces sp. NPDC050485]|uniref:hypothetical protein n=1 Tax=Streptomyces sp. NPDC050485 TaxID=3365617 RepID=UPI0037AB4D20